MKVALLDVNVLLALAWPNHQHHGAAHKWFGNRSASGWATCALTQLGFIRLCSNPSFTAAPVAPKDAAELLAQMAKAPKHHFWTSPPAAEAALYQRAMGHQQVNDAYLVAIAEHHKGQVATFDRPLLAHARRPGIVEAIPPL